MTSPFSFHCMICFEEFDPDSRYPVVLPCGHTYVCSECAARIDKCMECRVSLLTTTPAPPAPTSPSRRAALTTGRMSTALSPVRSRASTSSYYPRTSPAPARQQQQQQSPAAGKQGVKKERLPLPKNAVLLSLMEATNIAEENACSSPTEDGLNNSYDAFDDDENTDTESDGGYSHEERKIQFSTSLALDVCGTYAVAVKEGLTILPFKDFDSGPSSKKENCENLNRSHNSNKTEEDENRLTADPSPTDAEKEKPFGRRHRFRRSRRKPSIKDSTTTTKTTTATTKAATSSAQSPPQSPGQPYRQQRKNSFSLATDVRDIVLQYQENGDEKSKAQQSNTPTKQSNTDSELDANGGIENSSPSPLRRKQENDGKDLTLSYGDRLQVVSIQDKWAKLARGYGYVYCPKGTELVKVGGSLDTACRLEAVLNSLAIRRNRLKQKQAEIERVSIGLMRDFQGALTNDDDLTVILASTFSNKDDDDDDDDDDENNGGGKHRTVDENGNQKSRTSHSIAAAQISSPPLSPSLNPRRDSGVDSRYNPVKDKQRALPLTRQNSAQFQPFTLTCFSSDMLSGFYSTDRRRRQVEAPSSRSPGALTTSSLSSEEEDNSLLDDGEGQRSTVPPAREDFNNSPLPHSAIMSTLSPPRTNNRFPYYDHEFFSSDYAYSAGARAWRRQHGVTAARGIDFRTGMSGHMAIQSRRHAHPHDFLTRSRTNNSTLSSFLNNNNNSSSSNNNNNNGSDAYSYSARRMSSHSGLTLSRRKTRSRSIVSQPSMGGNTVSSVGGGGGNMLSHLIPGANTSYYAGSLSARSMGDDTITTVPTAEMEDDDERRGTAEC